MGGDSKSQEDYEREGIEKAQRRERAKNEIDREKYNTMLQDTRNAREEDMARGRQRGNELFGDGQLGRLEEGRAAEVADVIARRKANLNGFSSEEQGAMRDNQRSLDQSTQGQIRQLKGQQAAAGVRGPAALAQQGQLVQQNQQAKADQERQLFVSQIAERRNALDKLEGSTNDARKEELGRSQFNIGQKNKEKYGQLSTELGFASLGAGERSAIMQRLIGADQAKAAENSAKDSGGKK